MRVAVYCRVSTNEQTTRNQKRDLLRYCESRKWDVAQVFEDSGVSGSVNVRPALDTLMKQARQHRFDGVLVWRFDRFARSTQHLLAALQEFQSLGIEFISFTEGIDTSTPMGKLIYTFIAGIAEFERSLIQERVRAGLARAKAEGIHCGRPRITVDVAKVRQLREQGVSIRDIAKAVGVGSGTVCRALAGVPKAP